MSNQLEEKINSIRGNPNFYDISKHDDPIAKKTRWSAIKSLECSFRTHAAENINNIQFKFCATKGAKLFYLTFIVIGLGVIAAVLIRFFIAKPMVVDTDTIMLSLIGSIFAMVGAGMFYFWSSPMIFDKTNGLFWIGKKPSLNLENEINNKGKNIKLNDIYALQILSKYCRGKHKSIKGYELNLILNNAERIHIASHLNLEGIRKDADMLAEFLAIDIWDVVK